MQDSDSFDFNFRVGLKQTFHFDQHHCGKMFSHARPIAFADLVPALGIFLFVGYVQNKTRYLVRPAAGFSYDRNNIGQRAIKLVYEPFADDRLFFIPTNLSRYEQ